MDNQQATPTEAEIAWLAGILEGEGSLSLAPQKTGDKKDDRYHKLAVHIVIYNTDGGIIGKVVEIMEKMGVSHHISERQQKPLQMEGRPSYLTRDSLFTVKVQRVRPSLHFLETLRPWLFGDKGKRVDLMLKFLRRRIDTLNECGHSGTQGGFRAPYDVEDWQIAKEFLELGGRSTKMPLVERVLNEYEQRAREMLL